MSAVAARRAWFAAVRSGAVPYPAFARTRIAMARAVR